MVDSSGIIGMGGGDGVPNLLNLILLSSSTAIWRLLKTAKSLRFLRLFHSDAFGLVDRNADVSIRDRNLVDADVPSDGGEALDTNVRGVFFLVGTQGDFFRISERTDGSEPYM